MDNAFRDMLLGKWMVVYMDDILVGGQMEQEAKDNLQEAINICDNKDLPLALKKAQILKKQVKYLGMLVSKGMIEMDPEKLKGIQEWPIPKNLKEVQSFLGFANFYRKFIANYADLSQPLDELKKKDVNWE